LKYPEDFFNSLGEKTLRAYTVALNMARFDAQDWLVRDATIPAHPGTPAPTPMGVGVHVRGRCAAGASVDLIADALDCIRKVTLLTPRMAARLRRVDVLALKAGLLG
jgi:hypothetical protein